MRDLLGVEPQIEARGSGPITAPIPPAQIAQTSTSSVSVEVVGETPANSSSTPTIAIDASLVRVTMPADAGALETVSHTPPGSSEWHSLPELEQVSEVPEVVLDVDAKPSICCRRASKETVATAVVAPAPAVVDVAASPSPAAPPAIETASPPSSANGTPAAPSRSTSAPTTLPKHRLKKAFDAALSGGAGIQPRSNPQGALVGQRPTCKSPKAATVKKAGGYLTTTSVPTAATPSRMHISPTQRASWQKLRKFKALNTPGGSAVPADTPTPRATVDHTPISSQSNWFKQRVATELLGDAPSAPWEIDDEALFHRLECLVAQASGIVNAKHEGAADVVGASDQPFELLQALLSMQRTVQQNADAVRTYLEQADDGAAVAPSPVAVSLEATGDSVASVQPGAE